MRLILTENDLAWFKHDTLFYLSHKLSHVFVSQTTDGCLSRIERTIRSIKQISNKVTASNNAVDWCFSSFLVVVRHHFPRRLRVADWPCRVVSCIAEESAQLQTDR